MSSLPEVNHRDHRAHREERTRDFTAEGAKEDAEVAAFETTKGTPLLLFAGLPAF